MTNDALVDILMRSTADVLQFVHDDTQSEEDRRTVWAAFCATSMEDGVLRVPRALVDPFRRRFSERWPDVPLMIEPA